FDARVVGELLQRGVGGVAGRVSAGVDVERPVGEIESARLGRLVPHPVHVRRGRSRGLTANAAGGQEPGRAEHAGAFERRAPGETCLGQAAEERGVEVARTVSVGVAHAGSPTNGASAAGWVSPVPTGITNVCSGRQARLTASPCAATGPPPAFLSNADRPPPSLVAKKY